VVARFLSVVDRAVAGTAPATVLDVGCGEGVVTARLAALLPHARVEGLDVEDPALVAEWRAREGGNLGFRPGSAYALPHDDRSVDTVCCLEVLEHLERPEAALAELVRVARRAVVVSTPREPLWRAANMLSGRYLRDLGNTPGHVNHFSRRGLVALAGRAAPVRGVWSPFPWTIVRLDVRSPAR
jgi:2-polyprenyl-3-methyl-5-hydroxy-6-metoxy-1,4-benzoquinol methylase